MNVTISPCLFLSTCIYTRQGRCQLTKVRAPVRGWPGEWKIIYRSTGKSPPSCTPPESPSQLIGRYTAGVPPSKEKPGGMHTGSSHGLMCWQPHLSRDPPPQLMYLLHDLGGGRALLVSWASSAPPRENNMRTDRLRVITAALIQDENGHVLSK